MQGFQKAMLAVLEVDCTYVFVVEIIVGRHAFLQHIIEALSQK